MLPSFASSASVAAVLPASRKRFTPTSPVPARYSCAATWPAFFSAAAASAAAASACAWIWFARMTASSCRCCASMSSSVRRSASARVTATFVSSWAMSDDDLLHRRGARRRVRLGGLQLVPRRVGRGLRARRNGDRPDHGQRRDREAGQDVSDPPAQRPPAWPAMAPMRGPRSGSGERFAVCGSVHGSPSTRARSPALLALVRAVAAFTIGAVFARSGHLARVWRMPRTGPRGIRRPRFALAHDGTYACLSAVMPSRTTRPHRLVA